jgi:hypothetical protein
MIQVRYARERARAICALSLPGLPFGDVTKIAIQTRSATGQSNVQTMYARGLAGL